MTPSQRNRATALILLLPALLLMGADRKERRRQENPAAEGRKRAEPKNVNELFRDARKLFDDEKYTEATIAFNRIIKKYPTHQPSLLLYARSLYKLEKINEAYYLFSRVNPQLLDPDAAYEYGQVFYAKQQYGPALQAFQKIPANHSFADLARYYGGVCAVKLKQYELAEDLMSKALVLPEKEAKSRGLYLKHIARLRELKQKQALAAERVQERARLKAELDAAERSAPSAPSVPGSSPAEAAKPPPAEYVHKGFETVTKRVEVGIKSAVQNVQKNENSEGQAELTQIFLNVLGGTIVPFGPISTTEQGAFGLQILGKGYEDRRRGTTFVQTRESENAPVVQILRTPSKSNSRIGEFDLTAWSEFPLRNGYWTSVSGNFYLFAPEFARKDRTGSRAGILKVGQMKDKYSVLGTGSITESFNAATKVEQTAYHLDVTLSYKINDEFSTDVAGAYENYNYGVDGLSGPDSLLRGTITLVQSLPLGMRASLKTDYEYLQNYLAHGMPSFGVIAADGQALKTLFTLSATPFSWLRASLYGRLHKTYWQVSDPEQQTVFNINVQDYLSEYGASISANLFF